jgi:glycosyltransferase involved in cell wall biosynthesis
VPAENPVALGDAMRKISTDPGLISSLSDQAARRSLEFRWDRVAQKYLALYEKMISVFDVQRR